jgi:tetratricopeptide (TPR) repeat protein
MRRSVAFRLLLSCLLLASLLTGCTRDPNARKQKYFDSGEKYFAEGKYREAVIQYSNAIQIDSRFAQAHYQLAQSYLKLGDKQRAYNELTRTVELASENYGAHTDLANLLSAVRRPDNTADPDALKKAKEHLDIIHDKAPNSPETHEAWSNYYSAQNNFGAAMQEAQQAINLNPGRSESYLVLALLQDRSKLFDQAESNYKKAVEVDPKAMNAQLLLGSHYQTLGHLSQAEQQFRNAIAVDPKDAAPRAALEFVLLQQGKRDETEAFLKQTKKDLPDNASTYTLLGDFYVNTGDLDKAVAEYGSLYSDHPKDIHVKKNYIQLLILKNRLDEAAKLNNEILKSRPNDVEGLIYKGQILLGKNDSAGAAEALQAALHNDSDNSSAHYQLGLAYAQQRNLGRAEQEWREAVRLQPSLTEALLHLADLEFSRGETDATLQTAEQIISTRPYLPNGYILKAAVELETQKLSDAQHDAEEANKRAPQNPTPYVQLGTAQLAQKHYPEAEKFYQQALEKDPSSSAGLNGLMRTYIGQKEIDKAIAAANAQIAKSPNSNLYDLLGTALYELKKDYPGSEAALRKAVELDKNNIDALQKLGKVQVLKGNTDQAIALYQQSIKDNPHEVVFYILAGELYESKQNWDQAKAMYQQALGVSADNPLASNNLAYVILEQGGNVDVAMNMAQTARRGSPNRGDFADTLGWAYYQKGIYQSAINQFQEALRLNEKNGSPDDAVVHYHLGLAYQKANQKALARQQLEKAVKLKPDHSDARKALSQLQG